MTLDKYRARPRSERYVNESAGLDITLAECGGRAGVRLAALFVEQLKAPSGGAEVKLQGEQVLSLLVPAIAASVIDETGARPLDNDEGRAIVEDWPSDCIIEAGQIAARLNGLNDIKKA